MQAIEAHVCRLDDAQYGVQIRAVVVKESAGIVDFFLNHPDLRFEQPQCIGIGQHQRRDSVIERRVETRQVDFARVGAGNREQIERVFYRAFAQLMPSSANFSLARAVTLQAAQDLYGAGSAPYNAVRDAGTAVGVN